MDPNIKKVIEFVDDCVNYALSKSYDPLRKQRKTTLNANEYALVACFFDTVERALFHLAERQESSMKKNEQPK